MLIGDIKDSDDGNPEPENTTKNNINCDLAIFRPLLKYNHCLFTLFKQGNMILSNGHDGLDVEMDIQYYTLGYNELSNFFTKDNN